MNKKVSIFLLHLIILLFLLIIISCPELIDDDIYNIMKDKIPPEIIITSPTEGSICASVVEIAGIITDKTTEQGGEGQIETCTYEVPGSIVSGDVSLESGGSFSFRFITTGLSEIFTIHITAADTIGNKTIKRWLRKRSETDGIPSFTATTGNQQIKLEWDPLPEYEVWKAPAPEGPYINYSGLVEGTIYVDDNEDMENDTWYYYKIKPFLEGTEINTFNKFNGAQPDPFLIYNVEFAGSYDTPGNAKDVFISGSYAYVADYDSGLQIIDLLPE